MTIVQVIGFTGTIASGKTTRCQYLLQLARSYASSPAGAVVSDKPSICVHYINADKVGHEIYLPGKPCYYKLIEHFGRRIVEQKAVVEQDRSDVHVHTGEPDGEPPISRRTLGSIVFADAAKLAELSAITWPFIHARVREMIDHMVFEAESAANACTASEDSTDSNSALRGAHLSNSADRKTCAGAASQARVLVLLEAAILIESGGMLPMCNQVWITHCDKDTAVARVMQRDGVTKNEAVKRVESQADIARKREILVEKHYSGEMRSFDTSVLSLEEGLIEIKSSFDTYWQQHMLDAPQQV